jgi:hypothetical protein
VAQAVEEVGFSFRKFRSFTRLHDSTNSRPTIKRSCARVRSSTAPSISTVAALSLFVIRTIVCFSRELIHLYRYYYKLVVSLSSLSKANFMPISPHVRFVSCSRVCPVLLRFVISTCRSPIARSGGVSECRCVRGEACLSGVRSCVAVLCVALCCFCSIEACFGSGGRGPVRACVLSREVE